MWCRRTEYKSYVLLLLGVLEIYIKKIENNKNWEEKYIIKF